MARGYGGAVLRRMDGLFGPGTAVGVGEGRLLDRVVARGDGATSAFEAIVARHGPMVWGVCRHALRDRHDAEDAFQATFLILARRVGAIRERDRLGGWLHGVAARVAARARRDAARRPLDRPAEFAPPSPDDEAERRERAALLHDEIARLPGKYRDPIVLCHLEGCTHDEAAARLGWPVGTVRGRLARGRDRLRDRLTRRGLTVAAPLPFGRATSPVPEVLAEKTVNAAIRFAAGGNAAGCVSAQSAAWVIEGLRAMTFQSITLAAALAAGVVSAGAGALALAQGHGPEASPPVAAVARQDSPAINDKTRDEPDKPAVKAAPVPPESEPAATKPGEENPAEAGNDGILTEIAEVQDEIKLLRQRLEIESNGTRLSQQTLDNARLMAARPREQGGGRDLRDPSTQKGYEEQAKALATDIKQRHAEYIKGQVKLARLEKRLRALQAQAAEPDADAKDDRIVEAESEIDILRDGIETERRQIATLSMVILEERIKPTTGLSASELKRRDTHLDSLRREADELSTVYRLHRKELAKLQRDLRGLQRRNGVEPSNTGNSTDLERRLSRLESAVEAVRAAVEKKPAGGK